MTSSAAKKEALNQIIRQCENWKNNSEIKKEEELYKKNIVKAAINEEERVLYCFRTTPALSNFRSQISYIKKVQGFIAYKRSALLGISKLPSPRCEEKESIEQLRIISNGLNLYGVLQRNQVSSIYSKEDLEELYDFLYNDREQYPVKKKYLNKINASI